jgi:hypothetical protein
VYLWQFVVARDAAIARFFVPFWRGGWAGGSRGSAARGRGLFASTPEQNSGAEQNCSLSGCAKVGGYSARHHKPPCVCGCPSTGRWRFPPCCYDEIAAVATSRFCTIFRRLRICEAQQVIFSKKKLAGVECRITAEHYDGGDLHAFCSAGMRAKELKRARLAP